MECVGFIETLKWEAPLKTTVPPAVEWVEGHERIGDAAKVACEMAQRHGLGVVLGRRQVGVRKKRQQTTGDNQQSRARRRIWKFLGVPHNTFGEDVTKMAMRPVSLMLNSLNVSDGAKEKDGLCVLHAMTIPVTWKSKLVIRPRSWPALTLGESTVGAMKVSLENDV